MNQNSPSRRRWMQPWTLVLATGLMCSVVACSPPGETSDSEPVEQGPMEEGSAEQDPAQPASEPDPTEESHSVATCEPSCEFALGAVEMTATGTPGEVLRGDDGTGVSMVSTSVATLAPMTNGIYRIRLGADAQFHVDTSAP